MNAPQGNKGFRAQRRRLLKWLGLGSAALAARPALAQVRPLNTTLNRDVINMTTQTRYLSIRVLRPEDLLSVELRYYNFTLQGKTLQRKAAPAYLVVVFPPQTMAEQCWNETASGLESPTLPGRLLLSGESRLVFSIPAEINTIPLQLTELLAWEKYQLVVNARAKLPAVKRPPIRPNQPKLINLRNRLNAAGTLAPGSLNEKGLSKSQRQAIAGLVLPEETNSRREAIVNLNTNIRELADPPVGPPAELETALELPFRLYLSPTRQAGWKHRKTLKSGKGLIKDTNRLFELWHTRLATKTAQGLDESALTAEQRLLRALWADDAKADYKAVVPEVNDPFLQNSSMTGKDRHQIVHETSNFQIPKYLPAPIRARKLFLTTLGAWLDSELQVARKDLQDAGVLYGNGNSLNLLKWRHIETLGREHYVEIVKAGHILPFGHEAVLVKITERKPHGPSGTATPFQRRIVVITEPVKEFDYETSDGQFRNFCFNRIEILTTSSPLLDSPRKPLADSLPGGKQAALPPKLGDTPPGPGDEQFVIISKGSEVLFKIRAEDLEGNTLDFSIPLAFVSTDVLGNAANVKALTDAYNAGMKVTNRSELQGQKLALAPLTTHGADTKYAAYQVRFTALPVADPEEPQGFLPQLGEVEIVEPSYQRLTGLAQKVSVSLVHDKNPGHVFAKFNYKQPVNFGGQADKTGGIAVPNFNLSGLSKAAGAFGGKVEDFANKVSSAVDYFNTQSIPDPTLFGVFKLSDILSFADDPGANSFSLASNVLNRVTRIPNLVTEETATEYITSYVLKPKLKSFELPPIVGFIQSSTAPGPWEFSITTQVRAPKNNPTAPRFMTDAYLKNFAVGVVKTGGTYLINIDFRKIGFKVEAGKKADVTVDMANPCIVFGGPLTFLNEVNKLIPANGFSDPPYLDVSLTGIKCGYTLALPNLQMGAFTLSHLSLGAEVNLPFTGAPLTLGFRFCERQQPFTLTVSCLGGGGFFGLELDLNGIRQIEAALEFGAAASINLGVASGAVSIMAGIYFKMVFESGQNSTQLTGYVRINGAVSVLGLITASLELYMALTWLIDKEKAFGEASLKIKVEVLFFSKTVTIHTQRSFAGNGSDPNFGMSLTQGDWEQYCAAFAA